MKAPLRKVRHGHFGHVFFFFFACVHPVGLAYILSDLRTCTQRMFAGNISDKKKRHYDHAKACVERGGLFRSQANFAFVKYCRRHKCEWKYPAGF